MVSTFGCNNGLILAGARAYYAMARDGLFFRRVGELNTCRVPAWGLIIQGIWAGILVLPRTVKTDAAGNVTGYGNLYGNLLDYVISAALIFYVLTIIGIFVLRRKQPDVERPYKAFGYPVFWVNRSGLPPEELGAQPDAAGRDLSDLVRFIDQLGGGERS